MQDAHPILAPFLKPHGTLVLDGALATELENRGHDINDTLWSARLLIDNPAAIESVHSDYLYAGADCIISASYQATIEGFIQRGLTEAAAIQLLKSSVELAIHARDQFWSISANRIGRARPLVAASVGPYGAYLANGAEYTGDYDLDTAGLVDFHRKRWQLLAHSGADMLACETVPSYAEVKAFQQLLQETASIPAWVSFACRDGASISDGTPIEKCIQALDQLENVAAVGVNCTAPQYLPQLIAKIQSITNKPIIVYPNSGESYDATHKVWHGTAHPEEYGTAAREWRKLGAALIGGCCRTTPKHVQALSERFHHSRPQKD